MKKLLALTLLTGLVGCGAPQVDAPIDLDVQVGEDGKDGKDGINAFTNLFYNNVDLGKIRYINENSLQLNTSQNYRVSLSYSVISNELNIESSNLPVTVFYGSNDCSGDGITTARIGVFGSQVRRMYLEDGHVYTAMADLANPYRDINFSNINSFKIVGDTIGSCTTTNIDTQSLLNDTVFIPNDAFVSGWNNNNNVLNALFVEER